MFQRKIDECKRLWVMDTGKFLGKQSCPPQLLAFDLNTDKVVFRHIVNKTSYNELTTFMTPIADVRPSGKNKCASTFVYVADPDGFSLLVVDVSNNRSWVVRNYAFYLTPSKHIFSIDGIRFELTAGIVGLALSPFKRGQERKLYFHALTSTTENVINTSLIRNASYTTGPVQGIDDAHTFKGERKSQSETEAMDRNGILYYGMMNPPSIWCWNSGREFARQNLFPMEFNRETLQFASGVKVVTNNKGDDELWILTSSYQRVLSNTLFTNRTNFRIQSENLTSFLKTSPCRFGKPGHQ